MDPDQLAQGHPQAFHDWHAGMLRPWRLTIAFNQAGFDGDWVEEALGVPVARVDSWERGIIYPTWAQLTRVAALTGIRLPDLLRAPEKWFKPNFARSATAVWAEDLRRNYSPAIVEAAVKAHPQEPTNEAVLRGYQSALLQLAGPVLKYIRTQDNSDMTDLEVLSTIR